MDGRVIFTGHPVHFISILGADPRVILTDRPAQFIRAYGMTTKGLFRVPGHNKMRQMALARAQDKDVGNLKILFAPPSGDSIHKVDPMSLPGHMSRKTLNSMDMDMSATTMRTARRACAPPRRQ